jgi:competence protein ComEC
VHRSKKTESSLWEHLFIALLITCSATPTGPALLHALFFWNVGQGQMISWVEMDQCSHFDVGGEKFPAEVISLCSKKVNRIYITHADFDHINFLPRLRRSLAHVCLAEAPLMLNKIWQWRYLHEVPPCLNSNGKRDIDRRIQTLTPYPLRDRKSPTSLNAWSKIYVIASSVLIPGDSIKTMERSWVNQLPSPESIEYMAAGHHGSDTSTSEELLRELTNLKVVIISARKARYGHPNRKVLERIADARAMIHRTENHGHFVLEMPRGDRGDIPFPGREPQVRKSHDHRSN